MSDLLLATATVLVLTAGACLLGVAALVAPLVLTVDLAERRRFSASRWGAAAIAAAVVAVGSAYALRGHGVLLVAPLALTWVVPVVLSRLDPAQRRLGGRPGRHE